MADDQSMTVRAAASKLLVEEHADVLREAVRVMLCEVMEAEVSAAAGADWYERSPERETHRNGYRQREWDTRVGTMELSIPRLRTGSYFPSFLEPRRRSEQALVAVVQEAYINGVSTRKVAGGEGRPAARRRRGRSTRLPRLPGRAPLQAAVDQPAGAGQP